MIKRLIRFFRRKPVKKYTGVGYQFRTLHPPLSLFMRGIIINFITKKKP